MTDTERKRSRLTTTSSSAGDTAERELVITRVFDAPRELVWNAWIEPERLLQWWGPRGFTNTFQEIDVRPGGVWRFIMHGPDGVDYQNRIIYDEIVKPERLVYLHDSGEEGDPGQFRVTVTFADEGGQTRLAMRMRFASTAERDRVVKEFGAIEGANQTLDRLAEHLANFELANQELTLTRIFAAPRELVWRAWTEPEHFARWWGPKGYTTPYCKIDLRPGGLIHFCMRSPEGRDIWNGGVFREVVAPARLVSTDYFADEHGNPVSPTHYGLSPDFPAEAIVTVTFEEQAGKTKVTLRQTVPASIAARHGAQQGWNESFDRLAEYLATA